jgi:hypothetical protein
MSMSFSETIIHYIDSYTLYFDAGDEIDKQLFSAQCMIW